MPVFPLFMPALPSTVGIITLPLAALVVTFPLGSQVVDMPSDLVWTIVVLLLESVVQVVTVPLEVRSVTTLFP